MAEFDKLKKYYKELGLFPDKATDVDQRQQQFLEGRQKMQASKPEVWDNSFYQQDKMKTTSPNVVQAKVDAFRAAREAEKGVSALPESTYDAGAMKKEMMGMGKPANQADNILDYTKLKKAMKGASKGLKAIPILGSAIGLGSALSSGDAAAAVPGLDQEALGYETGTLANKVETQGMGSLTPEEYQELMKQMRGE